MPGREGPVNPDNFLTVEQYLCTGKTLDIGSGTAHPHISGDDMTLDADDQTDPDMVYEIDDTLPFSTDRFTNTTAIHVLEHLEHDQKVWEEMKRVSFKRAIAVVPIGERDDDDHSHVYDRNEAIKRFQPDEIDTTSDPGGLYDMVMIEKL